MDNEDIVIGEDWTKEINGEYLKLGSDWVNVIKMSEIALQEFKEKGSVIGLAASVTVLLEYNKNSWIFEEKVKSLNEANGDDIIWQ